MSKKYPKGKVIEQRQCPVCMDSGEDNLKIYSDNSNFCYGCWSPIDLTAESSEDSKLSSNAEPMIEGRYSYLQSRGFTEESCRKWTYQIGKYTGKLGKEYVKDHWVRIATYCTEFGKPIAQKIKDANKKQKILGDANKRGLYGQWLWPPNPKLFITIVEGEEEAIAVSQALGHQFPVVSIKNGAGSAATDIAEALQYLNGFKYVVLAFDNDEAGKAAIEKCLNVLDYGKVRIAEWSMKDANEMLLVHKEDEIRDILFRAKEYKPQHIVTMGDIREQILIQPTFGRPFPWKTMTDITYGRQPGDMHIIVAAPGIGKTEFIKEIIFDDLEQGGKIGLFSFEQTPANSARRLIGSKLNRKLHLPGSEWDAPAIDELITKYDNQIWFSNFTGQIKLDDVFNDIKYLAKAKGIKSFFVDNLSSMGVSVDVDKATYLMTTLQALKLELGIEIFLLSHVNKDAYQKQAYVSTSPKNKEAYDALTDEEVQSMLNKEGMDWESGRMPTSSNVDGPTIVVRLTDYVWGLARNTVSEDATKRRTTRVKPLKTRLDSEKGGKAFKLFFTNSGRLEELDAPQAYDSTTDAF